MVESSVCISNENILWWISPSAHIASLLGYDKRISKDIQNIKHISKDHPEPEEL